MDLLENLNPSQKKAITWGEGPLLIVAGAGTGKTTVITKRLAWLIQNKKANADQILTLTFTDKAAAEMEDRVDMLLPFGYHDLWVSTFHAFGEKILHENALEIGLPNNFRLLTENEQWMLLRQNIEDLNLKYFRPLGNPTKFLQALVRHFSRLKDENITPEEYLAYAGNLAGNTETVEYTISKKGRDDKERGELTEAARISELASAYSTYQKLLVEDQALDFGDLITYTLKLLRERPSLLEKYRKQFRFIMVDEFQDTNHAQYELVKLLASPHNNLTVCLDDDQAIYKFRGASVSNVLEFKHDFANSEDVVLVENYRSPQNILDLAYEFIQYNNPNRLEYQLQHGSGNTNIKTVLSKKLHSQKKEKGIIEYIHCVTAEEEVSRIMEQIIAARKKDENLRWSDFAILIRANDQSEQFVPMFDREEIPYHVVASKGLFQKSEIIDLLSYLRMLDNYHESRSLYRVLNFEIFNIPPIDIVRLLNFSTQKSLSLFETLPVAATIPKIEPETVKSIGILLALIQKHTQLAREKTAGQVLLAFLQDSGYLKNINTKEEAIVFEKVRYLEQFYKEIERFEKANRDKSVKNFVATLQYQIEAGDEGSLAPDIDTGPDAVKIMTIHAAKGLEFSYIFVVDLVDKRFPSIDRKDPLPIPDALVREKIPEGDVHLEEERRLFYVACTRAKHALFFTSAEDYGGSRRKKPSRFLYETGFAKKEEKKKIAAGISGNPMLNPKKDTAPLFESSKKPHHLTLPGKFSFTQIKAFETCPYQYRFAHLLRIPVEGRPSFSFGKTLHNTLFQVFKRLQTDNGTQAGLFGQRDTAETQLFPLDEILEIYKQCWIDDWYPSKKSKEEYRQKGKDILKEFHRVHDGGKFPKTLYLEKAFYLKIGSFVVKGVIDRLDPLDSPDQVAIIDYKTGRVPKNDRDIDWDQLYLYALACQDVFQLIPRNITYYYLEENKPITREVESGAVEKMREKIQQTIATMQQSQFLPTPGFHCRFCDFQSICEYKKI